MPESAEPAALAYELRVGVTGHRDLADPPAVERAVQSLLRRMREILGSDSDAPIEWVAVSPLARGADRIVARAILEIPGAQLKVITPFELDEYRKDFADPADRAEFEQLLARVSDPEKDIEQLPGDRQRGYLDVGHRVLEDCEILIAVWDGKESKRKGGTAEVVELAVAHGRTVVWIDATNPAAEPVLISPDRRDQWLLWFPRRIRRLLLALPWLRNRKRPALHGVDRFHRAPFPHKARKLCPGYLEFAAFQRDDALDNVAHLMAMEKSAGNLKKYAAGAKLSPSRLDPVLSLVLPHQTRASELAAIYQNRHIWTSKAVFYLSAAAVCLAALQAIFLHGSSWPTVIEILCMIAAFACVAANLLAGWHGKWLHYRYIAEQLRMTMFAPLVGEDPLNWLSKARAAIPFYIAPTHWLTSVARRISARLRTELSPSPQIDEPTRAFVLAAWLRDQARWHHGKTEEKETMVFVTRGTVLACFALTFLAAILHLKPHAAEEGDASPFFSMAAWLAFAVIVLPSWGAAAHAIGKQFEHERIGARYRRMSALLELLAKRAENATTDERFREIIREAIDLMGLENYEWWVLLSFAPPELAA